jgi:cyclase
VGQHSSVGAPRINPHEPASASARTLRRERKMAAYSVQALLGGGSTLFPHRPSLPTLPSCPTNLESMSARLAASCLLLLLDYPTVPAQPSSLDAQTIAPGVWFLRGDASKGYCNNIVIEMSDYLIVVDANYPGRARELVQQIGQLSPKPVRFVFDTHAHRDHSYGNIVWTHAGATTFAFQGVADEMDRYEPERWLATAAQREDVRSLNLADAPRPQLLIRQNSFVLKDGTREVQFLFFGWAHTQGDGFVWLPKERILCTGDAAVNGPRNKLWDANLANWPLVLARALALEPVHVLPGHGDAGGSEILTGQQTFLQDLYATVREQVIAGETLAQIPLVLPDRDRNWIPPDLADDIAIAYAEITQHKPAGSLSHKWR